VKLQNILHLCGVHVESRHDDEILYPIDQRQVAAYVADQRFLAVTIDQANLKPRHRSPHRTTPKRSYICTASSRSSAAAPERATRTEAKAVGPAAHLAHACHTGGATPITVIWGLDTSSNVASTSNRSARTTVAPTRNATPSATLRPYK
jgi:hypothetical protein